MALLLRQLRRQLPIGGQLNTFVQKNLIRGASSHAENTNFFILEVWPMLLINIHHLSPCTLNPSFLNEVPTDFQALQELEYPERLRRLLLTPQREVTVELNITKDNGEIQSFNAYRVQHDNSRGPYKGGLRYHPQVDLDDVRR